MPKRPPTPPPPEDEPKYLTVVHPYPLNANLMMHADRRTLALWLACCTGKDVLLAMYHKPTSPGMVIIEVDCKFDRFEMLLGMHSWTKFMLEPTNEEADKVSKVFWCNYNSGRKVQKNGWNRVDIEENWFKGWRPDNAKIKFPYPRTAYCEVPFEAQTAAPLCLPLPQAYFPVPPPAPKPRVWSSEWISSKSRDADMPSRACQKIAPSDSRSMILSTSGSSNRSAQSHPPACPISVWRMATYHATQSASSHGPPPIHSIMSSSASRAAKIAGTAVSRAHSARCSAPSPLRPPSHITKQPIILYVCLDQDDKADRLKADQGDSRGTPSGSRASINLGTDGYITLLPRHAPESEGPDQGYEYEEDDIPQRSMAEAMGDTFDDAPQDTLIDDRTRADNEVEYNVNPWSGYDAPRRELPTKTNRKGSEEWSCHVHDAMCSPGVCDVRWQVERDRRREKERKDREEAKKLWLEKREKDRLRKLTRTNGRGVRYDQPLHVAHGPRKGAGGSGSNNKSSDETESDSTSNRDSESAYPATSPDPDDSPLAVCMRRAASVADPDGDEEGGEWNGITGAFTTAKNGHENASRDTAARCPAPRNGPSAASGRSTPTSTSGDVPASARRQPVRDTRSAASTRPLVSPMSNDRSSQGSDSEDAGVQLPPPERRQPTSKNSHSSTTPFTHSEQPTTADVAAGPQSESSESSGGVGLSTPESDSDSRSSTALHTTPLREADPTAIFQSASFNAATQRQHGRGPRTARTADLSNSFVHTQGGFPTFAEARWADPITAAQRSRRKRKSARIRAGRIGGEGEDESERAGEAEGRNALSVTRKGPQTAFPSVLDVVLPPGGPGLSWGDPEVVW